MQKESKTDKYLRTGFVLFLVMLLLLIIYSGTMKTSDVSNWIIAFANIAMAAAAVKAWLAARKFLSEFFAQEGYRLAITLINENVIHLGIDNKFNERTHEAIIISKELHGKAHTEINHARFQNAIKQLEIVYKQNSEWLRNIEALSFKMETYGIYIAEDKKLALINMVLALDNMVKQGKALLSLLQKDFYLYDKKIKSKTNLYLLFFSDHQDDIYKANEEINKQWQLMVSSRKELLSGGKHARTLFVVRDI